MNKTTSELLESLVPVLSDWAGDMLKDVRQQGEGRKLYPQGAKTTRVVGDTVKITIDLDVAAASIEWGRKAGKQPPREAILKWIKIEHIVPKNDTTMPQLAYLIARKIGRVGTKAKNYLSDTIDKTELPNTIDDVLDEWLKETMGEGDNKSKEN